MATHMAVMVGADFFTIEVLTWRGLATPYVLFFLNLGSRRVTLGGIAQHPTEPGMTEMARNGRGRDAGLLPGWPLPAP